jgi:hypothetical protein
MGCVNQRRKIRYRLNEIQALMQAGVRTFVVIAKNRTMPEVASILLKVLPSMLRFLENHRPPFIAKIAGDSKVSVVLSE